MALEFVSSSAYPFASLPASAETRSATRERLRDNDSSQRSGAGEETYYR